LLILGIYNCVTALSEVCDCYPAEKPMALVEMPTGANGMARKAER